VLLGLCAAGAVGVVIATSLAARPRGPGDRRLGAGAAVVRGGARVAPIGRVSRARGRGRLPQYLAPARGPVVDSARVGALAARLVPGTETGSAPQVELVPRDSVAGLAVVARLVVTPGRAGAPGVRRPREPALTPNASPRPAARARRARSGVGPRHTTFRGGGGIMSARARVTGIGGVFFKARDPAAPAAWYREHLGVPAAPGGTHALLAAGPDAGDA
jgi:hypothetical protein